MSKTEFNACVDVCQGRDECQFDPVLYAVERTADNTQDNPNILEQCVIMGNAFCPDNPLWPGQDCPSTPSTNQSLINDPCVDPSDDTITYPKYEVGGVCTPAVIDGIPQSWLSSFLSKLLFSEDSCPP